ncbi:MAG: hypothetical protein ACR2OL_14775 [Anderseniella sp.]
MLVWPVRIGVFLDQHRELDMKEIVTPATKKQPAFGSFAFSRNDGDLAINLQSE